MPRGIIPNADRMLASARACDTYVNKRTQGLMPPNINFYEHFVLLYIKTEKTGWEPMGYRCKHCEKIAATTKELALQHLHICTKITKDSKLQRQIFKTEINTLINEE